MIGILHISDIHFRETGNPVLARVDNIADAFLSRVPESTSLLVVATGDIAFSGKDEEYKVAEEFLRRLTSRISARKNIVSVPIWMVPGNHDCDFGRERDIRKRLLENLRSQLAKRQMQDASIVDELTSIQEPFFKLMETVSPARQFDAGFARLAWAFNSDLNGVAVKSFAYNTAWVSQKQEQQGQLLFPLEAIPPQEPTSPLVISLLHHPYNWQEATLGRAFRQRVEETSDIVLTGHEHESEVRSHRDENNNLTHYVEGDVLQDSEPNRSGFNVILIDEVQQNWQALRFAWNPGEDLYAPIVESPWAPLGRSQRSRREFVNEDKFSDHLQDPGAGFVHPRVRRIRLGDIFLYPDVDVSNLAKRETSEFLSGSNLLSFVLKEKRCFLVGPTRSGKTALSKTLYSDLRNAGRVPLLITGSNVRPRDVRDPGLIVRVAFGQQYGPDHFERFFQMEPSAKAVLIDDFHRSPLNQASRTKLVRYLISTFDIVLIFVDEEFALDAAVERSNLELFVSEFRVCKLREFGHLKRDRLIQTWCNLGEAVSEEDDKAYRIADFQRTIDTVLGRRLLPSYPIFVLTLLQILESGQNPNTITGSYGYIYETLIAMALARAGGSETLDVKFAYLAFIAYKMFTTGQHRLLVDTIQEVAADYFERYRVRIAVERMSREFQESDILVDTEQGVAFRYSYLYYFFVAKYFQLNIDATDDGQVLRKELTDLGLSLYNDESANILMFYVYLTKDQVLIRAMVDQASKIFAGVAQCDFSRDVEFVVRPGAAPALAFSERVKARARDTYLSELDKAEESQRRQLEERADSLDPNSLVGQISSSTKTIQVIGQILRNFPGSLKGDMKRQMAAETYRLGLRTLGVVLREMRTALDSAKEGIIENPSGPFAKIPRDERIERVNRICFFVALIVSTATLENVSDAVGSSQLKETYSEVAKSEDDIGVSLIDLSVRIKYLRPFPEGAFFDLYKAVSGNPFLASILQVFALEFIYLYPCKESFIQKICNRLGIRMKTTKYLDERRKL